MLASIPELRRDHGLNASSTPIKSFKTGSRPSSNRTNSNHTFSSLVESGSPTEDSSSHVKSCPNSPLIQPNCHSSATDVDEVELFKKSPFRVNESIVSGIESTRNGGEIDTIDLNDEENEPAFQKINESGKTERIETIDHRSRKYGKTDNHLTLKQRLLTAISKMIPFKESLTVRLLINYTIDEEESDSILIDETVCTDLTSQDVSMKDTYASIDSGCIADVEEVQDDEVLPSGCKRRRKNYNETTNVLDLSIHTEREDLELETAMNNEIDELDDSEENTSQPSTANMNTGISNQSIKINTQLSTPFPISPHSNLVDAASVMTNLFPSLQTQHTQNRTSNCTIDSTRETAEQVLFKQLQAILKYNNQCTNNPATNNAVNAMNKCETQQSKMDQNVALPSRIDSVMNPLNLNWNNQLPSLISFPLLNALTADQMTNLLPSMQLLNSSLTTNTTPNPASFEFTSMDLSNAIKDKFQPTCVGLLPPNSTKPQNQPSTRYQQPQEQQSIQNILGQFAIPQTSSLTFHNLSQLFNNSSDAGVSRSTTFIDPTRLVGHPIGSVELVKSAVRKTTESKSSTIETSTDFLTNKISQAGLLAPSVDSMENGGHVSSSNQNGNQFIFGRRINNNRCFVCNQCRKSFTSLADLNRHTLETHNSFKCTICSAHFTQRSNLQRHSLKHVGFKPFTCNVCKKEYYRKDHLVRHIEVTHPNFDPKMNITVHLTSSECLDYLDHIHAAKQASSSEGSEPPEQKITEADTDIDEPDSLQIYDPSNDVKHEPNLDEPSEQTEISTVNF